MSARARVIAVVTAAAAAAAALAVGFVALTSDDPESRAAPLAGAPRLLLDLGVRDDREAEALRRAAALYENGNRHRAREIFDRHASLDARVGSALARWPDGTLDALRTLAERHPRSALVHLHLGLVFFWNRDAESARAAWRVAARVEPNSLSAVRAGNFLYPNLAPGLPFFVPTARTPPELAHLRPPEQLAALERRARRGGVDDKLLLGSALQRLGRPVSARRQFAAAVEEAPGALEPQVALAVASFTKARPARAFARLGPLAGQHPRSPTVRFHLGVLLLWIGELRDARRQLLLARANGAKTRLGAEAKRLLDRLPK